MESTTCTLTQAENIAKGFSKTRGLCRISRRKCWMYAWEMSHISARLECFREEAVTSVLLLRWSSMVVKTLTIRWPSILRQFSEEKVT